MSDLYNLSVKDINLDSVDLSAFKGKTLLIVNVASKCGFTPQYKDLQHLSDKYKEQGLEVLGFPCNQFGGQEPGTNEEVQSFCDLTFNVSFQLFDKVEVNGSNTSPLFKYLKHKSPGIFLFSTNRNPAVARILAFLHRDAVLQKNVAVRVRY